MPKVPDRNADYIVIDTETTGLDPDKDEVLSLTILGPDDAVLFDSLIKPQRRKRWPKSQEIHGISPADVADSPTLASVMDQIEGYFDGSRVVVGYNVGFDLSMLKAGGLRFGRLQRFDVMKESEIITGSRHKLADTARIFGYGDFDAHGSLEDARATAFCYRRLMDSDDYMRVKEYQALGMPKESARITVAQSSGGCLLPIVAALAAALGAVAFLS